MKAYLLPIAILTGILGLALWNSAAITDCTARWQEQLQQADALAQAEAWTEALDTLSDSYADWSKRQTYLHIVVRHDALDEAESLYHRALSLATDRELPELRAELSALGDQLRLLAEMERLDIKNVL